MNDFIYLQMLESVVFIRKIKKIKFNDRYSRTIFPSTALKEMDAWNALLANEYHTQLGNEAGEYFDVNGFIAVQVEV